MKWKTFFIVFEGLSFGEKIKIWHKIVDTSFKDDINEDFRWHELVIAVDYNELMNFLAIDKSDCEEESSDLVLSVGASNHFFSFTHCSQSLIATRTVLFYVLSTKWCSKAFL